MQAVAWVPQIPHASRQAYEAAQKQGNQPNFVLNERDENNATRPAAERQTYYPVTYAYPAASNTNVIGFDLGSEPQRAAALAKARDSGNNTATPRLRLIEGADDEFGFLIFVPIYRDGIVPETVAQRRANLKGFGLGVFRASKLIDYRMNFASPVNHKIEILVFDVTVPTRPEALHPPSGAGKLSERETANLSLRHEFNVYDRTWAVLALPANGEFQLSATAYSAAGLILITGLLFGGLLAQYFRLLAQRAALVEERVGIRTQELQQANETLQATQAQLELMALYDNLTGLANRKLFYDTLRRAISGADRHEDKVYLLLMDLDDFKSVNDTHGHQIGDRLLRDVAQRLKEKIRREDLVARLGGDEFAIIIDRVRQIDDAIAVARNIVDAFIPKFISDIGSFDVGISVGIAVYPDHGDDGEAVVNAADLAMYEAKKDGGGYRLAGDPRITRLTRQSS